MSTDAASFLRPNTRILALPRASRPRLYLSSESASQRWRHSGFYPAFRWTAQAFRVALRLRAALGLTRTQRNPDAKWALSAFVQDCLPELDAAVVSLGTPGPAQKATVQLWCGASVVGYLKYAKTPAAKARLEQEHRILRELPGTVGPTVLKCADFSEGRALVTAPVAGRVVSARLPLGEGMRTFLRGLRQPRSHALESHPWVLNFEERFGGVPDAWLEPLANREWPVVFQHGDFTPWNVLQSPNGARTAIDWEYGSVTGFPHLDAAHYLLQTGALIRRWRPVRALANATRHLDESLSPGQAEALVRLAAFEAFQNALVDGNDPDAPLQAWRRAVWEAR